MSEKDPGVSGKKLSKSDDNTLEQRNKSYERVLKMQCSWIIAMQSGWDAVTCEELRKGWKRKSEWHEKEFGW